MCVPFDHKYLLTEIYPEEIIDQIYKNKCKTMFTEAFITTQKNKTNFIFFCLVYQQQEHFLQGTTLMFPAVKNLPDNAAVLLSHFSHVWLFLTPWTVVPQAPLPMRFSRQEYWSGLPCPDPEDLFNPGIELMSHYVSCTSNQVLYH